MALTRIGQTGPRKSYGTFSSKAAAVVTVSGSILPTVFVEAELSGVGNGWTDITSDVLLPYGITLQHGIQGSGPADNVAPTGTGRFALNNSTTNTAQVLGYYSPYNSNKRTGWGLGIGCRVRFQDPNTLVIYTRFVGRIDAIYPQPGQHLSRAVIVTVTDWMDEAAKFTISPDIGVQVGQRADEIMASILAQMPRQPVSSDLDSGVEIYSYALDTSPNTGWPALAEFVKLSRSEFGLTYVKGDGTLRFEGRHSRLLHTTVDWAIADADLSGLSLPSTRDEIINVARTKSHPKLADPYPTTVVYDQVNPIFVAVGQQKFLLGPYRDPFTADEIGAVDVQPQIAGTDFIAYSNEAGTGSNITADFDVAVIAGPSGARFTVTNGGLTDGWLTTNRLLGRGLYDHGTQLFEARDEASVAEFGEHPVDFDMDYQEDDDVAQGAADYILLKYSSAFAQARTCQVIATSPTLLTQILARDISDRISLSETVTGLNSEYFINGMTLRVGQTGHLQGEYVLAPAADPFAGLYWVLGTSVLETNTIPAPF